MPSHAYYNDIMLPRSVVRGKRTAMSDVLLKDNILETLAADEDSLEPAPETPASPVRCANPNRMLVPFFYFCLGFVLAMPSLALKYFYATVLGLSPALVSTIDGLVVLPWMIKPVFGLISDTLPIFGRHRMPYVVATSSLAAVTWYILGTPGPWDTHAGWTIVLLLIGNFGICFSDVIVDTLLVAQARLEIIEHHGKAQSNAWIVRHAGSLLGAILGASLVGYTDVHNVFIVTGVLPTILCICSFALREPPRTRTGAEDAGEQNAEIQKMPNATDDATCCQRLRIRTKSVYDAVVRKGIWRLIVFVVVLVGTPSSGSAFFFFLINEIGFSKQFMGTVEMLSGASLLLGVLSYRFFFRRFALRKILFSAICMSVMFGSVQLVLILRLNEKYGIDDKWFVLGDEIGKSFVSQLVMMPLITLVGRVCPRGDEGTLYAGIMSIFNLAAITSNISGSYMTFKLGVTQSNFDNLWILSILCTTTSLLPLFFLCLVPKSIENIELAPVKTGTA